MYDLEIPRIIDEIRKRKAKRVLIQLPEGLKPMAREIIDLLSGTAECVLSADACYGACDVKTGYDLTIHFGHSKMLKTTNVIYVETHVTLPVSKVVQDAVPFLGKRVGLITTAQHINRLEEAEKILKQSGKKVLVGKKGERAAHDGQILGCDFTAATSIAKNVDTFLFIGSGQFHPQGASFFTGKKVVQADPYSQRVDEVTPVKWEKEKYLRISKAMNAQSFGAVVSTKPGQSFPFKKPKNFYLIELSEITPERLDYLPFDAFVITACPRIVFDDWKNFKKPVLLPNEYEELLKIRSH